MTRPPAALLVFVGTLIGAGLAGLEDQDPLLLIAIAISNMLLCAGSMVINDWHDVAEDRINRPDRPIASGRVSRRQAAVLFAVLFVSAVAVAALADWRIGILAALVTLLSIQYSLRWKRIPFWGNAVVALAFTYTFACWIPLLETYDATYVTLTLAFFVFSFGREIVKTGGDVAGDAPCGVRTVATWLGVSSAHRIGTGLVCCALVVGSFPILSGMAGWTYAAILVLSLAWAGVVCACTWLESSADEPRSSERYLRAVRAIQLLMAIAITTGLSR